MQLAIELIVICMLHNANSFSNTTINVLFLAEVERDVRHWPAVLGSALNMIAADHTIDAGVQLK